MFALRTKQVLTKASHSYLSSQDIDVKKYFSKRKSSRNESSPFDGPDNFMETKPYEMEIHNCWKSFVKENQTESLKWSENHLF